MADPMELEGKRNSRRRIAFAATSLLLLLIEIAIGLWAHDDFVRPYLGDTLVVILIWSLLRTAFPKGLLWLSGAVLLFAVAVELTQIIPLCDLLGIRNSLLRVLMGTSFAYGDLLAYAAGCALTAGHDLCIHFRKPSGGKAL